MTVLALSIELLQDEWKIKFQLRVPDCASISTIS